MLETIEGLLRTCNEENVRYCHWKSNEYLDKSLAGETDLDVLCDPANRDTIEYILHDHDFERLEDVPLTGYPGIENYVGYDRQSGQVIHVHLHYELTIGTPYLKEYVTPWAETVLDRRTNVTVEGVDVPITDPTMELFLLIVRYSLKIRRENLLARRKYLHEFYDEYDWLCEQADETDLETLARKLVNDRAATQILEIAREGPTVERFVDLGSIVRSELEPYCTTNQDRAFGYAFARKVFRGLGKLNRELLRLPLPSRRTVSRTGIEVAIVGIDGSGKSTHLSALQDSLGWKMDVYPVYFGSGDGRSSLARYPLKKLLFLRNWLRERNDAGSSRSADLGDRTSTESDRDPGRQAEEPGPNPGGVGPTKALWAILLAREKRQKRKRARRARERGMIVLMDRFPQADVDGINDGPLLAPWRDSSSHLRRRIAHWEANVYREIASDPPDLLIKLETDPEIASARSPETPMPELHQKALVIDELEYDDCRVVSIDTHQDIEAVRRAIETEIWATLNKSNSAV